MTKPIVAFRNFATAPKNESHMDKGIIRSSPHNTAQRYWPVENTISPLPIRKYGFIQTTAVSGIHCVVTSEVLMQHPVWAWTASKQTALTGLIGCSNAASTSRGTAGRSSYNGNISWHTWTEDGHGEPHLTGQSFTVNTISRCDDTRLAYLHWNTKSGQLQKERERQHAGALRLQMLQIRNLRDEQTVPPKISVIFLEQRCNISQICDWARFADISYSPLTITQGTRRPGLNSHERPGFPWSRRPAGSKTHTASLPVCRENLHSPHAKQKHAAVKLIRIST